MPNDRSESFVQESAWKGTVCANMTVVLDKHDSKQYIASLLFPYCRVSEPKIPDKAA